MKNNLENVVLRVLTESYDFDSGIQDIKNQYSELERLNVVFDKDENIAEIKLIRISKDFQGKGIGTQVMQDLVDLADDHDVVLTLTPEGSFGVSTSVLTKFYKKFGFVSNSGSSRYYGANGTMVRTPEF